MLRYRSNVFLSYQEKKKKQEKKRNLPFLLSSLCNKVGTRIQFVAAADIGFISSEKVPTFEDNWIRCCASGKETSIEYRRVFQSWFVNKCVNGGIIFFSRRSSIRCLEFQRVRLESFLPGSVKESLTFIHTLLKMNRDATIPTTFSHTTPFTLNVVSFIQ